MYSDVECGFFNIGTGVSTSIIELANKMISSFKLDTKPLFQEPLKGDVKESKADVLQSTTKLSWRDIQDFHIVKIINCLLRH